MYKHECLDSSYIYLHREIENIQNDCEYHCIPLYVWLLNGRMLYTEKTDND